MKKDRVLDLLSKLEEALKENHAESKMHQDSITKLHEENHKILLLIQHLEDSVKEQ